MGLSDLASPGPSVTVEVPASGLVEVYAQAHINGNSGSIGGIGLAIDGTPGGPACVNTAGLMINGQAVTNSTYATGGTDPQAQNCGTQLPGVPQSLMISAPPGQHTFKLVYSALSSGGPVTVNFSDRRLSVAPRP